MGARPAVSFNNAVYAILATLFAVAELPPGIINLLPERWKHTLAALVLVLAWVKSHHNLFINPDSTSARAPWDAQRGDK